MQAIFKTTQFDNYIVRQATINDKGAILHMLKSAAAWLKEKGLSQWGYILEGSVDEEIEQAISEGITYVVENQQGGIIASFNFANEQNSWDVYMWGERNDHAFYIHKLVVHQDHRHNKIGSRLMKWIDNNILLEDGFIRLDCVAGNPALNAFYREAGFEFKGYAGEGENLFSLYEKSFSSKS